VSSISPADKMADTSHNEIPLTSKRLADFWIGNDVIVPDFAEELAAIGEVDGFLSFFPVDILGLTAELALISR